jgi:copper chaperone
METQKYKTNIKCGACIATVTPFLNSIPKIDHWEVDITNPDKTLTIQAKEALKPAEVIEALNKAGYQAETQF